jgi:hypothetical protein
LIARLAGRFRTPEIFMLLGENHITIVTFAPHTTNIFQNLDFSFFGVFKTKEKFCMYQDDDKTFTATIAKLFRQFHSVATPENIHGNFVGAGFSYSVGAIPYVFEWMDRSKKCIAINGEYTEEAQINVIEEWNFILPILRCLCPGETLCTFT